MKPNEMQVGGSHYQSEYQHWDFVIDVKLHYLLACATKYIVRWRSKNGLQDLKKARHFIVKAFDVGIIASGLGHHYFIKQFIKVNDIPNKEAYLIHDIVFGEYAEALKKLDELILKAKDEGHVEE